MAALPIVLEATIEVRTAQREDSVGPFHGPEHSRLFEAMADNGFAAGLNNPGADKEMLLAEGGIFMRVALLAK